MEGLGDITNRHKIPIDFCFLDGFNPAHNPDLWSDEILLEITKNLDTYSQITTFTAAGKIKRRLEKLGFEIKKVDGDINLYEEMQKIAPSMKTLPVILKDDELIGGYRELLASLENNE